jgi:hypothetical protein
MTALSGERHSFSLAGQSVASFYHHVHSGLSTLGVDITITHPQPFAVLDFYDSAYQAGARHARWDIAHWACPGGVTDPHIIAERHAARNGNKPGPVDEAGV